jgi:hypothetical protein
LHDFGLERREMIVVSVVLMISDKIFIEFFAVSFEFIIKQP